MEEALVIVKRLLRRALSVIYISIGFFMVLAWIWSNYLGVAVIAVAYLVGASIIYGYIFKPLIRYREFIASKTVEINKVLGIIASIFGLSAMITMIIREYIELPVNLPAYLGLSAVIVSLILLLIGLFGSSELFGVPEIGAIVLLGATLILYLLKPAYVLPVIGTSFMCLGMYTYWLYYMKPPSKR